jgi:hypothetical protein
MDKVMLSKYRSEVIERFINIEWIINAVISQHYFRKVIEPFLFEVLYDEYFSFALKRRIIEKVIKNVDKSKIQDLNRLNTIRNYFAHCNQEIIEGKDKKQNGKIIDPRNIGRTIDFESLYKEFMKMSGSVEEYLFKVYKDLGGVAENE